jgi:hypothetical protein
MHYHPWAQNLWFPLGLFVLTGLVQIPLTVLTGFLTGIFTFE